MNINDLRKSISDMTDEELLATIKDVRTSRRITRKPNGKKVSPGKSSMSVEAMPPDLIALLINKIEGSK